MSPFLKRRGQLGPGRVEGFDGSVQFFLNLSFDLLIAIFPNEVGNIGKLCPESAQEGIFPGNHPLHWHIISQAACPGIGQRDLIFQRQGLILNLLKKFGQTQAAVKLLGLPQRCGVDTASVIT